ncbi:MAG TPA: hypothetical protein VMK42_04125 [Anaeromyxobacteraceae bacterium]|nr:hypothetical protein [Anaeromyxobacteraceae bacterium]
MSAAPSSSRRPWRAALAGLALAGCGPAPQDAVTACQNLGVAEDATDILFVVDDSGSMYDKQQDLAQNFGAFIARLAASPARNAYQIGITTTSVDRYAQGMFSDTFAATGACPNPPSLGGPYPRGALVSCSGPDIPAARVQSTTLPPRILPADSPTLVADFTSNVAVGICGSGREQGLEAARLALSEPALSGPNAGFLRSGARLVVILVSDDDDCSDPENTGTSEEPPDCTSYPVSQYLDFFAKPIGGETKDVFVAGIIAVDPETLAPAACVEAGTGAQAEHPAYRYKAFIDALGSRGLVDSVCNASFEKTLVAVAAQISQVIPLSGAPADPRLLAVGVVHPDGSRTPCSVKQEGDPGTADVSYLPPSGSRPPALLFGGACALEVGDQLDVKLLCVG